MKKVWLFATIVFLIRCTTPLVEDESFLENLMKRNSTKFDSILSNDSLEVQIIYTQINRDSINRPNFKSFYYHVDSTNYFYPASTVKLPQVLLALEKINELRSTGFRLDKYTAMYHDSVYQDRKSVV